MTVCYIEKKEFSENDFLSFLAKQGIVVKTNTHARGNLGICFKNRIDISKKVPTEKRLQVLFHEYAHKIHYDIEKESFSKGGSLQKLFNLDDVKEIEKELIKITNIIDENSLFFNFYNQKDKIYSEINELERIIKKEYPEFKRSQDFKPAKKYLKSSPAKYLLRYDNVKIVHPVFRKESIYSIKNIDNDFHDLPESIRAYIKLKSCERLYKRLYRAKNKAEKYYTRPTELFARFVEGIYSNKNKIIELAPLSYSRFEELLNSGYYGKLKELFILAGLIY